MINLPDPVTRTVTLLMGATCGIAAAYVAFRQERSQTVVDGLPHAAISSQDLADATGLVRGTAKTALRRLISAGLVRGVSYGPNRGRAYRLLYSSILVETAEHGQLVPRHLREAARAEIALIVDRPVQLSLSQPDRIRRLPDDAYPLLNDSQTPEGELLAGNQVDDINPPVDDINPPVDDINPPVDDINPPVDDIHPPVGDINPPVGDIHPPVDDINPPVGDIHPPVDDINPPVDDINPPVGDIHPPVDDINPPVGDIHPPVDDINPPESPPTARARAGGWGGGEY